MFVLVPVCNGVSDLSVSWDGQENEYFRCSVVLCFLWQCCGGFLSLA